MNTAHGTFVDIVFIFKPLEVTRQRTADVVDGSLGYRSLRLIPHKEHPDILRVHDADVLTDTLKKLAQGNTILS